MKIAIAGTGYVGLVTGICFASKGHQVTCVDVDYERIKQLRNGKLPIFEEGLAELMGSYQGNLSYTTDYMVAYQDAEIIFIAVGTPEKKDGSANLQYIYEVADHISEAVERDCVIALKSTVPVGTGDKVEQYIVDQMRSKQAEVHVVSNPEFLSQGTAVHDMLHPTRIVIGSEDKQAKEKLLAAYSDFGGSRVCTDRKSAEMIKYASNDFLALKLSYINEIANLCELVGADIEEVTYGMGFDERIGNKFMRAGIGYGGSCFPKDTRALSWFANFNEREIKTIKAAIEVNEQQKMRLIKKARKYCTSFRGIRISVLGLTFKPDTDDLREAPSLINISWLLDEGAVIKAWDPIGTEAFSKAINGNIIYCDSIEEALKDTEICFIFTEWQRIKDLDTSCFEKYMAKAIILDGRNCFSLERFSDKNVIYESIGRPIINRLDQ